MKILLCSVPFRPSVGGIEAVSAILAEHFHALGHEVVLITQTPSAEPDRAPYPVVRRPDPRSLYRWVRWADVVLHNNISLRWVWPLLLLRRPWVVAHHTWLPRRGTGAFAGWLKRRAIRFARNIAVSEAMARSLPVDCEIVPNPYADDVFRRRPEVTRLAQLIYVGRLVSDKGVDTLLRALAALRQRGRSVQLTIVGSGPEDVPLRRMAGQLGLRRQVRFVGPRSAPEVAGLLNAHGALVVPSRWEEPFGLVAIEALACGCVPVVARSGGLPEAIGAHGHVFAPNDSEALAECLEALLPTLPLDGPGTAEHHLARHRPEVVARAYLAILDPARAELRDAVRA